jgi:uncharacterized protein (DUF305 family)
VETVDIQVRTRWRRLPRLMAASLAAMAAARAFAADPDLAAFAGENEAAMTRMMSGMHVKSSGDIDRDFAAMMIAHHQGAIEMAQAQLRYGKNEQLRRIAQEIIIDQMQEIAAMRMAVGQPLPPATPAPTRVAAPAPSSQPQSKTPITHP